MLSVNAPGDLPLTGLQVVAIEHAVAAPLCSRHLSELGADVIKVERPGVGDLARGYDSAVLGQSTHFVWLNHGKRSLALDFSTPDGASVLREILGKADVLLSNLSVGAVQRHLDIPSVRRDNPGLIWCRISGYGPEGPYSTRRAYDALVQGEAGITRNTGTPNRPAKPGVSLADVGAAIYALSAIVSAVISRERTGQGTEFDIALFDVATEWMMPLLLAEQFGRKPEPAGVGHASIVPYGVFRTLDDVDINIAVQTESQWVRLCRDVLHDGVLSEDPTLRSNANRLANRDYIENRIETLFKAKPSRVLMAELNRAEIPWGLMNDAKEVLEHPQLKARRRWRSILLPAGDKAEVLFPPFGMPADEARSVPLLGEHTVEILSEIGKSVEDIQQLLDRGFVAAPSPL